MNIKVIGDGIFVYHHFLNADELNIINKDIAAVDQSYFKQPRPESQQSMAGFDSAMLITKKIQSILSNNLEIKSHNAIIKMVEGQF
jgi:hypothetical protein